MVWCGWFDMVEYVVVRFGWLSCDERPPGPQSSAGVGIDSAHYDEKASLLFHSDQRENQRN